MPSEDRYNALVERLDADGNFAAALQLDTFTALRDTGFDDLAPSVEEERARIAALVDRIYEDVAFREAVELNPTGELVAWGLPEEAIAPVLVLVGAPDDVVDRATADVEAHLGRKPATIAAMAAVLGTLAFAQQATAASQPASTGAQVAPAALAQVTPAAQAQVTPAAQAQVTPAARSQVTRPSLAGAQVAKAAQVRWQGVQPDRVKAQGGLSLLLRTQGLAR